MAAPAPGSFSAQLAGLPRWASGGRTDDSQPAPAAGPGGWWSSVSASVSPYVPLRSAERTNEEEAYFALSRWERFVAFLACIAGGLVCFCVAFLTLPMLVLKPRKFAVAFTLGSLLFMGGFSVLMGPLAHLKHLLSAERLPFTAAYFGSLGLTLFFAVGIKSYIGTIIAAVVQVVALLSYLAAYFPGGLTTLKFSGQMMARGAGSWLPV